MYYLETNRFPQAHNQNNKNNLRKIFTFHFNTLNSLLFFLFILVNKRFFQKLTRIIDVYRIVFT